MAEESLCRLCAEPKPCDDLVGIKDSKGLNLNLELKIFQCFQLRIEDSDHLPKCVCSKCCEKVNITWEFNERVRKAQETLKASVNVNSDSENDPFSEEKYSPENSNEDDMVECLLGDSENQTDDSKPEGRKTADEVNDPLLKIIKLKKHSRYKSIDSSKHKKDYVKEKTEETLADEIVTENVKFESDNQDEELSGLSEAELNDDGSLTLRFTKEGWDSYPWICVDCGNQLSSVMELRDHCSNVHKHHANYSCIDCSKLYTNFQGFITHVRAHRYHLKFCCDVCGKFFTKRSFLSRHRQTHLEVRPHVCTICGKSFRMHSSLLYHSRIHLPEALKNKFQCDLCPKKFGTKPNLMAHKRIHTGIREFTCDQCGKSFFQKGNLDNHLLTHTAARPFSCNMCGKAFKTLMRLKKHESVHSGLKPHQCDVCGRQFRERGTLKEHHRIHTGAMPYACEFCGKCFRFKGVLTTHRRQHTGERPYSCLECQHHFTNWPNYNKHMKRRHGINTSVTVRKPQSIPPTGMPCRNPPGTVIASSVNNNIGSVATSLAVSTTQLQTQQQLTSQHMLVLPDTNSLQNPINYSDVDQTVYINSDGGVVSANPIGPIRSDRPNTVIGTTVLGVQSAQGYYMPSVLGLYNIQTVDPSQLITQHR